VSGDCWVWKKEVGVWRCLFMCRSVTSSLKKVVMEFLYVPVCQPFCCTAHYMSETAEIIQTKSLSYWLKEMVSIPGRFTGNILSITCEKYIQNPLCVRACVLYNPSYFRWRKESEGHLSQCAHFIKFAASPRLVFCRCDAHEVVSFTLLRTEDRHQVSLSHPSVWQACTLIWILETS
jgi:hypothetical protein